MVENIVGNGIIIAFLGWVIYGQRASRQDTMRFKTQEQEKRDAFESKVEDKYLDKEKHALLCENAGLKITEKITEHFDEQLKEYTDEIKKAIKDNGNKAS